MSTIYYVISYRTTEYILNFMVHILDGIWRKSSGISFQNVEEILQYIDYSLIYCILDYIVFLYISGHIPFQIRQNQTQQHKPRPAQT